MTKKSSPSPHKEFLESDEKANELFDFVCAEMTDTCKDLPARHRKVHLANKVHRYLGVYYFTCFLLKVFEKTPITKIKFDFIDEYSKRRGSSLSTSATISYSLKKSDGSFTEEKSCSLYSHDMDEIDDEKFHNFFKENSSAVDIMNYFVNMMHDWEESDIESFHETIFKKENVMSEYGKNYPEIYPLIEKFILSNSVIEAKEKAPSLSISKM